MMKNKLSQIHIFSFLTVLLFGTSCHRPLTKNTQIEKQQLTKNIGNVYSSLKDKSGGPLAQVYRWNKSPDLFRLSPRLQTHEYARF